MAYQIYENVIKFLEYRGYEPAEKLSETEYQNQKRRSIFVNIVAKKPKRKQLIVFLFTVMPTSKIDTLIQKNPLTKDSDVTVIFPRHTNIGTGGATMYTYSLFAVVHPELFAKHTIMSESEIVELENVLKTSREDFAQILPSDPQCLWIGATVGNVLKIERTTETNGKAIAYRYVSQ